MSDTRGPIATEGIYDGKPSLTLSWRADSPYPFSFGVTKARLILACLAEIQAFADKHPDEGKGNRGRGRPAAQRPAQVDEDSSPPFPGGLKPESTGTPPPARTVSTSNNDEPPC